MMSILKSFAVWLCRLPFSYGFGVQSPTDYRFVKHVICQTTPYYAYEQLGKHDDKLSRKLGRLYFRLANERQPRTAVDRVGVASYLQAACPNVQLATDSNPVQFAIVPAEERTVLLLNHTDDLSVVVVHRIDLQRNEWRRLRQHSKVSVSYDLYYCGILLFDAHRAPQHYKMNL